MTEIRDYATLAMTITDEEMANLSLNDQRIILPHLLNAFQASIRHSYADQAEQRELSKSVYRLGGDEIFVPTPAPKPDESRLSLHRKYYSAVHCSHNVGARPSRDWEGSTLSEIHPHI